MPKPAWPYILYDKRQDLNIHRQYIVENLKLVQLTEEYDFHIAAVLHATTHPLVGISWLQSRTSIHILWKCGTDTNPTLTMMMQYI